MSNTANNVLLTWWIIDIHIFLSFWLDFHISRYITFFIFICWSMLIEPFVAPYCPEYQMTLHQTWAVQPPQMRILVFSCWERTVKGEPRCTESSPTTSATSSLIYRNLCLRWVKKSHRSQGQNIVKSNRIASYVTHTLHRIPPKI